MKRALIVGIDHYQYGPLHGCVSDAVAVANVLEKNGDRSPNFSARLLTSDRSAVTTGVLHDKLDELFKADADTVLFFFAGHEIINETTNAGYIVAQDGCRPAWGLSLSEILARANAAHPRIKSTVIILDSCRSGLCW